MIAGLKERAGRLKHDTLALYLAARHPDTPWFAKALAAGVAAYALSPIDLIPDAVPVLGLLDDLVIVPLGIWLAIRLVPPSIMAECRAEAARREGRPVSRAGAAVIIALWLAGSAAVGWWTVRWWRG